MTVGAGSGGGPGGERRPSTSRETGRVSMSVPVVGGGRPGTRPSGAGESRPFRVVRSILRAAFLENGVLKFVAFVLALTLFILVHGEADAVIGATVKVSYVLPEDRVLVSEPIDEVRIGVKGSWRRIRRFDERELEPVRIDLSQARSGELVFRADMFHLPNGLTVQSISPPSMRLAFESRAERNVPVAVQTLGRPAPGFKVDRIVVDPSQVSIHGAQSVVAAVTSVSTVEVTLVGRHESFHESVALRAPEQYVAIDGPETVDIDVTVVEDVASRELGPLPVVLRPGPGAPPNAATKLVADPPEVRLILRGPRLAVEGIAPGALVVVAEVHPLDAAAGSARRAPLMVEGVPRGVATELSSRDVTVRARP